MTFAARHLFILVAAGVAACGSSAKKKPLSNQEMVLADPLPLAKGSKWTYEVTIRRHDLDTEKLVTKTMSWTTEVLEEREANGVTAYRVKGWPGDLANFEQDPVPTERTILRRGNSFMFGASPEPIVDGADGWFSWPLIDGQKICPSAEVVYCWHATALEGGYRLEYRTWPDVQAYDLEPGTGVAFFRYSHSGDVNAVEAKLVSYQKAPAR